MIIHHHHYTQLGVIEEIVNVLLWILYQQYESGNYRHHLSVIVFVCLFGVFFWGGGGRLNPSVVHSFIAFLMWRLNNKAFEKFVDP